MGISDGWKINELDAIGGFTFQQLISFNPSVNWYWIVENIAEFEYVRTDTFARAAVSPIWEVASLEPANPHVGYRFEEGRI